MQADGNQKIIFIKTKATLENGASGPNQAGFPTWDPREDTLIHRAWAVLTISNPCNCLASSPCPGKHTAQRS